MMVVTASRERGTAVAAVSLNATAAIRPRPASCSCAPWRFSPRRCPRARPPPMPVVGVAVFLVAVLLSPETKGKVLVAELTVT